MRSLTAYASESEPLGYFRVFATPPGKHMREITMFRGAPIVIGTVTWQDPFSEVTCQLSAKQITPFDSPGEGDLDWLVSNTDIDIVWQNVGKHDFRWRWEGYIASYGFNLSGSDTDFSIDLKGCLYALDDYLAIPSHPKKPIPYEILIAQAFDQATHPASLGRFRILFPQDWHLRVPEWDDPAYLLALKPWGVTAGQRWTGFTSRSTGSWESLLTGHVQSLLVNMFDRGGAQWSIRNRRQRRPELYLRRIPDINDENIIDITLGAPGVSMDASRDFTQSVGVVYGYGTDAAGVNFSNIEVSPDGRRTYFKPFAYSPRMWPRKGNPNLDRKIRPKEKNIPFQTGIDEIAAAKVAAGQYQRFAEPGYTGSVTLTTDPRRANGELVPRLLIQAGETIRINGMLGIREGVLAHVTQVSADFTNLTVSLTYDTKYRDLLTVEEVRARTRDALAPLRALQVGKYANTIQDLIIPWSYHAGSGIIPTPAKEFFMEKLSAHPNATFPYETFTRQCPPKNPSYKNWYIEITPTDRNNSNNNWAAVKRDGIATMAIPIRMAEAGTIRLTQLAAYDKDGNVLPVKFHLSVWSNNGTAVNAAPHFPASRLDAEGRPADDFPKYLDARRVDRIVDGELVPGTVIPTTYEDGYTMEWPTDDGEEPDPNPPEEGGELIKKVKKFKHQAHPFFQDGWENVRSDGTLYENDAYLAQASAGFVVGWGNYYEPAGYAPNRFSRGARRTGILEDATPWSWSFGEDEINKVGPRPIEQTDEYVGILFILIYCDDQDDEPVYFMGRFVRAEPGQS